MKETYGVVKVDRPIFSKREEEADRWMDLLPRGYPIDGVPSRETVAVIRALEKVGVALNQNRICELAGLPRNEKTKALLEEARGKGKGKGWIKVVRTHVVGAENVREFTLTEEGKKLGADPRSLDTLGDRIQRGEYEGGLP